MYRDLILIHFLLFFLVSSVVVNYSGLKIESWAKNKSFFPSLEFFLSLFFPSFECLILFVVSDSFFFLFFKWIFNLLIAVARVVTAPLLFISDFFLLSFIFVGQISSQVKRLSSNIIFPSDSFVLEYFKIVHEEREFFQLENFHFFFVN